MHGIKLWMPVILAASLCSARSARAAIDPNLPPEESEGAIAYMSGGIDKAEAAAIKREALSYSLELEFLHPGKAYGVPAYVPVTIKDSAGNIMLDRASDGPFMLVQLPEGRYTVTAHNAGKIETLDVNLVPGQHKTLAFDWKG